MTPYVDTSAIRYISLFAGDGGLDLAVRLALPTAVCVCRVENEIPAAGILVARITEETLDDAPQWSDVRTFDGRRWRGAVDLIVGGFPCTDLSVAGKRAGIEGEASGLWWEFARIVRDVFGEPGDPDRRAGRVFIENVRAVISVDADRPGYGPGPAVLGELARLGFDAEWLTLRAADVGAAQERERVFILAYRPDSDGGTGDGGTKEGIGAAGIGRRGLTGGGDYVVDAGLESDERCGVAGIVSRSQTAGFRTRSQQRDTARDSGEDVGDAGGPERGPGDERGGCSGGGSDGEGEAASGSRVADARLVNAARSGEPDGRMRGRGVCETGDQLGGPTVSRLPEWGSEFEDG